MSKSRVSKENSVSLVTDLVKSAKGAVLVDFTGLKVKEMQELRRNLRASGIEYEVVKKSLLKRSLVPAGVVNLDEASVARASVSVAVSAQDEIGPAKVLVNFAKTHEKLKVLGGWLGKEYIPAAKVEALSKLPAKPEMLGQLVGALARPMVGLINVMQGNLRGLMQVLKAAVEKKDG
ncbi:MAG: 50S ribosomal protein L10 [Candidatus Kerfeldbacteria bacterium]|nr:50S ribosomal protein L10 [Candidatus Kerfeldbacteria bacterium]